MSSNGGSNLVVSGESVDRMGLLNPGHVVEEEAEKTSESLVRSFGVGFAKTARKDGGEDGRPLDDDGAQIEAQVGEVGKRLRQVVGQELDVQADEKN